MELSRYLQMVRRRRGVALTAFVVTAAATLILVLPQPWVYESTGTLLVRPRASATQEQTVNASDLLIRGVKIGATYATIARSDLIRDRAKEVLDGAVSTGGLSVSAEVLTDTNILSIGVRGGDPESVQALATAIAAETTGYVAELDDAYMLEPLDAPELPDEPVGPNKRLTIFLGLFLGALLGVGLALMGGPVEDPAHEYVMDPDTLAYNRSFLRRRLREEMSRADHRGHAVSLAVLRVALQGNEEDEPPQIPEVKDLRRIVSVLGQSLREEAVFAYLRGGTFAVLLPDTSAASAGRLLAGWVAMISSILAEEDEEHPRAEVWTGICEYADGTFTGSREAKRLARDLTQDPDLASAPPGPAGSSKKQGALEPPSPVTQVAAAPESPPARQDWRGAQQRRRTAWKGKMRAGDRAG